jgi:hypothetical protein
MTIFFRKLSEIKNNKPLKMLLNLKESFYKIERRQNRRCLDVLVYPIFE